MSIRLLESKYDPTTGISTAMINTDLGYFTGISTLHEEDKDIESTFAGCHYAEMRAIIKYMKKKVEILKYQIKGLVDCEKAMKNKKEYSHNSCEARTLRKQKGILQKEKKLWENRIKTLHQKTYNMMSTRRQEIENLTKNTKGDDTEC